MRIGVLALQGGFAAHIRVLADLGQEAREIRRPEQLDGVSGLVIPGGESTTLLNLMQDAPWFPAIRAAAVRGTALFGTCAGAILLSREVLDPVQPSLDLLDASIRRNGYGRQVDSFEAAIEWPAGGSPFEGVFIRAPRFVEIGPYVEVLGTLDGEPVLVRSGNVMAATFHPELTDDRRVHEMFLEVAGVLLAAR